MVSLFLFGDLEDIAADSNPDDILTGDKDLDKVLLLYPILTQHINIIS